MGTCFQTFSLNRRVSKMSEELRKSKPTIKNPRRKETFIQSQTNVDDQFLGEIKFKIPLTVLKKSSESLYSKPSLVHKLPWQLCIKGSEVLNVVEVFLECQKKFFGVKKTCKVVATLMIHNLSNKKVFKRDFNHMFYRKRSKYGFNDFIEFTALEKNELISDG